MRSMKGLYPLQKERKSWSWPLLPGPLSAQVSQRYFRSSGHLLLWCATHRSLQCWNKAGSSSGSYFGVWNLYFESPVWHSVWRFLIHRDCGWRTFIKTSDSVPLFCHDFLLLSFCWMCPSSHPNGCWCRLFSWELWLLCLVQFVFLVGAGAWTQGLPHA